MTRRRRRRKPPQIQTETKPDVKEKTEEKVEKVEKKEAQKPKVPKAPKPKVPKVPSLSFVYRDVDEVPKSVTLPIEKYKDYLSYQENFEDVVSIMIEDGGVWVEGKYVIPIHRVLRFDSIPETAPKPKDDSKTRSK